jgi:hypothetical protein
MLELTALAEDAAAHLRRHASPAVRVSAVLLLTASLAAACAPGAPAPPTSGDGAGSDTVSPLQQDVSGGLPTQAGRYDVVKDTIVRDRKGIYEFDWLDEQQQPHNAYASRLRLAQEEDGSKPEVEIPTDNADPILHVPSDVPIRIVEDSQAAQTGSSGGHVQHSYPYSSSWLPFAAGAVLGRLSAPSYYNPPPGNYDAGTRITGGTSSTTPPPPESRVVGLRSAVSGQSGGSGSGSAVTGKVGAPTGGSGQTGAPAPATGPGTGSGQAGGSGSGSAVTGKVGSSGGSDSSGGSSGSGVTSPSSGGFSGGKGSVGGGSSS